MRVQARAVPEVEAREQAEVRAVPGARAELAAQEAPGASEESAFASVMQESTSARTRGPTATRETAEEAAATEAPLPDLNPRTPPS